MRALGNRNGLSRLCGAVVLAVLFAAAAPVAANAEPGYSDGDGNSGGSAVIVLNPAFGDSLLEVDRTLNFNHGDSSSAGSDNEGGE